MDHIVPQASSGGDEPENLALCCKSCNIRKGDHISGVDPESREETLLFNPRQNTWNEHFDFDAGRFQLLGCSADSVVGLIVGQIRYFVSAHEMENKAQ